MTRRTVWSGNTMSTSIISGQETHTTRSISRRLLSLRKGPRLLLRLLPASTTTCCGTKREARTIPANTTRRIPFPTITCRWDLILLDRPSKRSNILGVACMFPAAAIVASSWHWPTLNLHRFLSFPHALRAVVMLIDDCRKKTQPKAQKSPAEKFPASTVVSSTKKKTVCKIEGLMAEAHKSIIHQEEFLTSLLKSTIFVQRSIDSVQMEGLLH